VSGVALHSFLRIATEAPIDFGTGVISAFLSAVTFIFVLWTIGGVLSFDGDDDPDKFNAEVLVFIKA
jgi:ABC-type uncharacterized transport system fused permease/ATPase subunit